MAKKPVRRKKPAAKKPDPVPVPVPVSITGGEMRVMQEINSEPCEDPDSGPPFHIPHDPPLVQLEPENLRVHSEVKPSTADPDDRIIRLTEAGQQIGVSRQRIWTWVNTGLIPCVRHPSGVTGIWQSDFDRLYSVAKVAHKRTKQLAEEAEAKRKAPWVNPSQG